MGTRRSALGGIGCGRLTICTLPLTIVLVCKRILYKNDHFTSGNNLLLAYLVMALRPFSKRALVTLPDKDALVQEYVGQRLSDLPTPSLVVDRSIVAQNCAIMHQTAKDWDANFRAHVKTHKTAEGVVHQLKSSAGTTHAVIVSTIMEAWHIVNAGLVADGTVQDILYGVPVPMNKIADLAELAHTMASHQGVVRLIVDNPIQIQGLEEFGARTGSHNWSVFIKVDAGNGRAGQVPNTPAMTALLQAALLSPAVSIYGFYCHAGNSYASKSAGEGSSFLTEEVNAVNTVAQEAAQLASKLGGSHGVESWTLSVGSTPTMHAAASDAVRDQLRNVLVGKLELHAGNYPFNDLQQLATNMISEHQIAPFVLSQVIAYYPGRAKDGGDEAMCDVGGIGMSRDTGPRPGYGDLLWDGPGKGWRLVKISQEHGTLQRKPDTPTSQLQIGDYIKICCQHACLTAAAYPFYFVVDSAGGKPDEVVDVWVSWKGW
ncbi:hypothetical protein BKA62DRAFT_699647 [Auriculariales sp. MPI-PUGE-AT-0066]|nr:hypothetical protein BKA62DRAFT_699647 [Auriculariales sp. MPI-PUGE-AT-0066]